MPGSRKGMHNSEAHNAAISEKLKGNKHFLGHKHSKESIEKMRNAKLGKTFSDEHKRKLSISRRKRVITEETKIKISISLCNRFQEAKKYGCEFLDSEYRDSLRGDFCSICNISKDESLKKYGGRLCQHHKDLDPYNHHPDNILDLCRSCHARLHGRIKNNLIRR